MSTLRSAFYTDWSSLAGWTADDGFATITPNGASQRVEFSSIALGVERIVYGTTYSVSSGIDRVFMDLLQPASNPNAGGQHIDLFVRDGHGSGYGYGFDFSSTGTIQGRYLQAGGHGNYGTPATYNATTARYAGIAIDVPNSQFHLQTAPAGADLTNDASWTTVGTLNFADESGFDLTGYKVETSAWDPTGASTLFIGALNGGVPATTPTVALAPTSRSFTATAGGGSPSAQTVAITNAGTGTLSGLSATIAYGSGAGWLAASLDTTTAPATLTLTPTTGALTAGTYTATVHVASSAPGVTNSPQDVAVTFIVSAASTVGGATSVHARALDRGGKVLRKAISYTTDRPDLVTISGTGLIQAISNPATTQTVTVTASCSGKTATTPFTVTHSA